MSLLGVWHFFPGERNGVYYKCLFFISIIMLRQKCFLYCAKYRAIALSAGAYMIFCFSHIAFNGKMCSKY